MKPTLLIAAGLLCGSCFGTLGVVGEYDVGYPPASYIATATPVYYEGYPSYWYGGRWYRREGASWRAYHDEPGYLRDSRTHAAVPVVRQSYGRGQYYAPVHGAVPVRGHR
jgi:hypothetical protein